MTARGIQKGLRLWLAFSFVAVGVLHFAHEDFFVGIMPPYLPFHRELVWISGVAEIAGGVGLLIPRLRAAAGWGLLALLVAVFPANVHMALNPENDYGITVSAVGLYLRLPFQLVFMACVAWCALPRFNRDG